MKLILKCRNKGLGPKNCLFVFEVPVQSQENEQSCICVLEVMYLCIRGHVFVYQRSCLCVLEVMYLCIRSHVFVYQRSCICVLEVMSLCIRGHVFVYQRSCICVLGILILPLYKICYWILELFQQYDIFFVFS